MICPKDNLECAKPQVCNAGRLCATPPPDMAEIERLVEAFGELKFNSGSRFGMGAWDFTKDDKEIDAARAALIAAIRSLSNSTQNGE